MTAVVSLANIYSLALLCHYLLHHNVSHGRQLIVAGSLIWLTNVVIFALWYWETDRGGPGQRAAGRDGPPDFLFPADERRPDRAAVLASTVHRLPVRVTHQRDGVQPHRHAAR